MAALVNCSSSGCIFNKAQNILNQSILSYCFLSFWWNIQLEWRRTKIFNITFWILMQQASYPQSFMSLGMYWIKSLLWIHSFWCFLQIYLPKYLIKRITSSKDQFKFSVSARDKFYIDEWQEYCWLFNTKCKVE